LQGGKFEDDLALYMESLLAETPLPNRQQDELDRLKPGKLKFLEDDTEYYKNEYPNPVNASETLSKEQTDPYEQTHLSGTPVALADPKWESVPGQRIINKPHSLKTCPLPNKPIFLGKQQTGRGDYSNLLKYKSQKDLSSRRWEISQKEPLVEIPIRRTKQYFAIIQEMEEYSEKRAAMALDGLDGRTISEKEEGIKNYERYFGGLRSLSGREKFQGIPPWERIAELERNGITTNLRKLARQGVQKQKKLVVSAGKQVLTPADAFRMAHTTNAMGMGSDVSEESRVERVVWRFEDVSWVKQRTIRPRKNSFVGKFDERVRLESGVSRYGPNGIGGGVIEGVGGVRNIVERGLDGQLRRVALPKQKKTRREIVV
jgi:hypothetical protein